MLSRASGVTLALTDGNDERAQQAARVLEQYGIKVLLLRPAEIPVGVNRDLLAMKLAAINTHRGMTKNKATALLADPLYLGGMLLREGDVSGVVGGASRHTADVIRAALQSVGLAAGTNLLSSSILLILRNGDLIAYGDCAAVPYPNHEQLAQIAISTAHTYQTLTGKKPVVAMLSFSTKGSATHESARRVRHATVRAAQLRPDLEIDGELQFDAAWVPEVGHLKAPGSHITGRANVFIFPNLDAGNIAYKITERLAGGCAFGPLLQGLDKPMHDLSRGCCVADIVAVAAVAAFQALQIRTAKPRPADCSGVIGDQIGFGENS